MSTQNNSEEQVSTFQNLLLSRLEEIKELQNKTYNLIESTAPYLFTEYFASHPEVSKLEWQAYAPYFNDGDPCVYSLWAITVIGPDDEDGYDTELLEVYNTYHNPEKEYSELKKDTILLLEFLRNSLDWMEGLGDGQFTVSSSDPTNIKVEYIDHD